MASNEEYLDSLLKSVSLGPDNPTSRDDKISEDSDEKKTAEPESFHPVPDMVGNDLGIPFSEENLSDIGLGLQEEVEDMADQDLNLSDLGLGMSENISEEPEGEIKEAEADTSGSASDMLDMSDMDALLDAVSGREAPDLQDVMQMSAKDIDSLLDSNRDSDMPVERSDEAQDELPDLSDLLKSVEADEDLEEITSLLQKSDDNQAVDEGVLDLLKGNSVDKEEDGITRNGDSVTDEGKEPQESMSKSERRAAEKKAKREAKKAAREAKKKKKVSPEDEIVPEAENGDAFPEEQIPELMLPGDEEEAEQQDEVGAEQQNKEENKKSLFSKIFDFFTEEDEPEDDEANSLNLSEENATILAEMKKEGSKKKKKAKKKKGKEASEGEEGQEEDQTKGKKGKGKKKEKKEKKENVPALEEVPQIPEKKLSLKRIILIALVTASILAIILIASFVSGDYSDRRNAREAYYSGNYQNCYQNLFGKKLDETESVMFNKSAAVLRMRMYMREYDLLVSLGQNVEALDSLIQTVDDYPLLYENAVQWNAAEDVAQIYQQMLDILKNTYGLSEEEAMSIASEPDDVEYTRMVTAVAEGNNLAQWKDDQDKASMKDVLPEEEELTDISFMENSP